MIGPDDRKDFGIWRRTKDAAGKSLNHQDANIKTCEIIQDWCERLVFVNARLVSLSRRALAERRYRKHQIQKTSDTTQNISENMSKIVFQVI